VRKSLTRTIWTACSTRKNTRPSGGWAAAPARRRNPGTARQNAFSKPFTAMKKEMFRSTPQSAPAAATASKTAAPKS
ncbi:hypothetical protein C1H57_25430, partial [Clostridium sp. 2-1]